MFDENLTMQQKEQIMNYLMKCYRKSSYRAKQYEQFDMIAENQATYRYDKTTCLLVEVALQEMDTDEKRIITHDFMYPENNQWYLEYYTRSTYYRLKNRAIDKFLRCLHT